ncbi:hypothetical protein ACNA6I_11075 [Rossellomorea sp. FS2]|uniref:hypothetical protein n=1 Tax=Rossellomorea TaxID=2837508 RepID=UPI00064FEFA0|nr:hypothetical protein [Rossellomorea marisflavi]KML28709.1 hypothetical protein VL12_19955 [Rossellomorea marisflavi]USK93514.1 hypothetical protein LIT29_07130 [Rossellomorea marisflavi]
MNILDTVPYFLEKMDGEIDTLRRYHNEYSGSFIEYFAYHCKDSEERLISALNQYPSCLADIRLTHKRISPIIHECVGEYERLFGLEFPINVNLIVGGFGSNAYTHREIIPDITFALERLSPVSRHLKTIVAHEFGHAAQNILSDRAGMVWNRLNWNSPLVWMNQEGAATHFSRRVVRGLPPSVYFHFNEEGTDWLSFAEAHTSEMKQAFIEDVSTHSPVEVFGEWFSIRGGRRFGFNRLGYYLGDAFFQHQVKEQGEEKAILAWKEPNFEDHVWSWLEE